MFDNISLQYPSWYILFCIALAVVYTVILYYKDKRFEDFSRFYTFLLGLLRFLSVFGIGVLLFNPLIKKFTHDKKKPLVIIAEDISKSISFKQKDLKTLNHKALINIVNKLSENYDVKHLAFSDQVVPYGKDSISTDASDLSGIFNYISENYSSDNVGAIIMSTDGIYNQGNNPIYTPSRLSVPIYTIALGDTTQSKDLLIKNIYHNKIAYLGNEFVAQVDIQAFNTKGLNTKLEVYKISQQSARKKVLEKSIRVKNSKFFSTIDLKLKAEHPGLNQYRIVLKSTKGELTYENNTKDIYVDVLDMKQKILLLANAPHPDLSAIRTTLSDRENYKIDIQYINDKKKKNLSSYDLIVFHNLPSNGHNLNSEIALLNRLKTPRLFISGIRVNHNQLNKVQDCIITNANNNNNSEIQAMIIPGFRSFIVDENFKRQIEKFPPLINGFGDYTLSPGSNALLGQKISKINTKYPLLAYKDAQGIKTGVLLGEGIWKWKYFDHLENSNNEVISQLLRKTFQFLTVKNDKRKLRVETSKKLYKENESILFTGQLFNDNYEPINNPELNIEIKDTDGNAYDFVFSRIEDYYTLDTKQLPAGQYTYTASCMVNGKKLEQKSRFSVKSIQLELFDLTARHDILKQLSDQSNGEMFSLAQSDEIVNKIINNTSIKPIIFQHEKSESLINYRWILALLILLLTIEWFIRRYLGSY